jgi:hypothetical protein
MFNSNISIRTREKKMKTYLVSYGQGNISISKVIDAYSEKDAINIFIETYDQYDITSNEVDVLECEEVKSMVKETFEKIKELKNQR